MIINEMPGLALDATTATSSDILSGKTAYNGDGTLVTGNIPSKSAATYGAKTSSQTISSGQYLSGAQTIAAVNVPAAANILTGSSVTSNGSTLVSGTMANRGTITTTTSYGGSYTIPQGYHSGSGKVTGGSFNFSSATITTDKVMSGYKGYDSSGVLITGIATGGSISFGNQPGQVSTFELMEFGGDPTTYGPWTRY